METPAGGDIAAWMEARHDAADHILCIVSGAYLAKPYSAWERRAAQWAAVTDRPNFAVPVFVEPCKAPTLFAHLKRCDLYGLSEGDARARLKTFLEPPEKPPRGIFPGGAKALSRMTTTPPSFPGKAALSNVPIAVPLHFMGRDETLVASEMALSRYEGRVAITALHGLRGVGKTTLAAAYAERHRGDYRATWWIRAQTADGMRADLVGLGVRLGWVAGDEKEEPALAVLRERLRHEGEVRQVAQGRREDQAREAARRALVETLAAVYPKDFFDDPSAWQRARRLDATALALVGDAAALPQGVDEQASYILNGLALQRTSALAAYEAARPLYERALAIREKVLGPEHPDTARSLNNLAGLIRDMGDAEAAEACFAEP